MLSPDIMSLLVDAFHDRLGDFEVEIQGGNEAGSGYLGEMVFINLRNKSTGKISHFVVKQTLSSDQNDTKEVMENVFFNEIYFYQIVLKELQIFQKEFQTKPFQKLPECLAFSDRGGNEKILMENIKILGFRTLARTESFDESHTKLLMETYGTFHGLSAAFREHNPQKFKEITSPLMNVTKSIMSTSETETNTVLSILMGLVRDTEIKKRLEIFKHRAMDMGTDSLEYSGKNPVINHGDCWSNNIMFKYDDDGQVADIALVDFQMCRVGSVVNDLAYLLYCGANKNVLDNMDYYLKIYHDSFSNTLRSYDLDPAKIFTFEDLKKEFKMHYRFGFIMSFLVWPNKLSSSYEKRNIVEIKEDDGNSNEFYHEAFKSKDIRDVCLNVIQHVYESDLL